MKRNKGFTLVELLIVIVIIGILAAIIVPSVSSAIEKANLANDQSDVKNMNTILALQAIEDNVDYYEDGYAVQIVLEAHGYDLEPQASGYSFWYNQEENKIELLNTEKALSGDITVKGLTASINIANGVYAADGKDRALEAICPKYADLFYIDNGNRPETNAIKAIRNLADTFKTEDLKVNEDSPETINASLASNYATAIGYLGNDISDFLKGHLKEFDPATTVYVSECGFFGGEANGFIVTNVKKVYIRADVAIIPACNLSSIVFEDNATVEINLPLSVEKVEMNAFTKLTGVGTDITIVANSNVVLQGGVVAPGVKVKGSSNYSTLRTIKVDYVYSGFEKDAEGKVTSNFSDDLHYTLSIEQKNYLPFMVEDKGSSKYASTTEIGKFVVDMDSIRDLIKADPNNFSVKVESRFDSKNSGHNLLIAYVMNKEDGTFLAGIVVKYVYITPEIPQGMLWEAPAVEESQE